MEGLIIFAVLMFIYVMKRGNMREEGKVYTGKIVDIKAVTRYYIIEAEIDGEIKTLKSLEGCPIIYSKKNYIGKKTKIYYNKRTPKRCSLVYNSARELKDHLED